MTEDVKFTNEIQFNGKYDETELRKQFQVIVNPDNKEEWYVVLIGPPYHGLSYKYDSIVPQESNEKGEIRINCNCSIVFCPKNVKIKNWFGTRKKHFHQLITDIAYLLCVDTYCRNNETLEPTSSIDDVQEETHDN